jgi:ubiquinol-cytochrome c reductase cytochrome c1 subunit
MKKLLIVFLLAALPSMSWAGGGHGHGAILDPVRVDLNDKDSLQRGARIFVNYCLSCHSAGYMRYSRMGEDLGISEELVKENLLFAADKVGDLMKAVMPAEEAKQAFGTVPPDLTLITRARSAEWFYTYMRSFYRDDTSSTGWDNRVFENVAMPHVLYEWQGEQRPVYQTVHGEKNGKMVEHKEFERFEIVKPGTMSPKQYDAAMRDLTNFLVYLGEPAKLERYTYGIYVLIFLLIFLFAAYLLKKEYWKDVH